MLSTDQNDGSGGVCPVGSINAPNSSVTIHKLVISQAGAASDGSGDLTLGTLAATAPTSGLPTLVLQAASGTSAGVSCKHWLQRVAYCMLHRIVPG